MGHERSGQSFDALAAVRHEAPAVDRDLEPGAPDDDAAPSRRTSSAEGAGVMTEAATPGRGQSELLPGHLVAAGRPGLLVAQPEAQLEDPLLTRPYLAARRREASDSRLSPGFRSSGAASVPDCTATPSASSRHSSARWDRSRKS